MFSPHGWRQHQQTIVLGLVAVVMALGCVGLGRWQWERYQHKHDAKLLVERNYDASPASLGSLLASPGVPFDAALRWRPVRVRGTYAGDRTVLVRNRPREVDGGPVYGYEVLVPLVLADGSALLVNRGWVPSGSGGRNPAAAPDAVPSPPPGLVEVVAHLLPGERVLDRQLPAGQVASIAIGQVSAMTGQSLYAAYGRLASESPAVSPSPALLGRPQLDGGEGINASYAVQWGLFAALALGFPFWFRCRQRAEAAAVAAAEGQDVPVAAATRRRRIWDDEDE